MRDSDVTSVEHLDSLLAEGTISEEDYDTLRAAMERKEEGDTAPEPESAAGTLHRSSRNRVIAGVCGGIAESTGAEPLVVRLLAVLLLLVSGGAAVLAYLVLALVLPSSDGRTVDQSEAGPGGFPWGFTATLFFMWMAGFVYSTYILPQFFGLWDQAGAELPWLTQTVANLSILGRSLIVIFFQVAFLASLIVLYAFLPKRSGARVAMWIVVVVTFVVLGTAALIALYLPLFQVGDIVR